MQEEVKQLINKENLRPFTTETASECGKKGQIKSTETKRRRKKVREALSILANAPVSNAKYKKILEKNGISPDDATNAAMVAFSIMSQTIKGNSKMAKLFLDLTGESAPTQIELTGASGSAISIKKENPLDGLTTEQLKKLADAL